jgi:hypothetical protein
MSFLRPRLVPPGPDDYARAVCYLYQISFATEADGTIWIQTSEKDSPKILWHYQPQPRRSAWSFLNLFPKPDLLLLDQDEREVLRIRRRGRLPATSEIIQDGKSVGIIRLRSILLNKYSIVLNDGPTWTFWMPLFTIHFYGVSDAGSRVWVVMGPKVQWIVLLPQSADDVRVVGGLAFIHRRWWWWWCTEIL